MSLTNYELWTFHDAIEHLLDEFVGGDRSERNRRQARRAVLEAYRELPARRHWRYYWRRLLIHTEAMQTDGTITYDHTGGANERQVTLSGATWPANAEHFELQINSVRYEVDELISSTVLTLTEATNPGEDLAAGTAYSLVRSTYPLPANCHRIGYLYDILAPGRLIPQIDPQDVLRENRLVRTAAVPSFYSVIGSPEYAGGQAIYFGPTPSSARTYDALALMRPLPLAEENYAVGTVAATSGDATVVGTGTAFTAAMVGAVIRFSATSIPQEPTSLIGETEKNAYNPFVMQRVIRSVTDATNLELEQAADQDLSGSGFRISSRLDIEPGAMLNAFLRCCEARFGPTDRKDRQEREAAYQRQYDLAAYADARMIESPGSDFVPHTLADMAASVSPAP